MTDQLQPSPPPASLSPSTKPSAVRLLEMALFAAVFLAGGVASGLAIAGGGAERSADEPIAAPPPSPRISVPPVLGLGSVPPNLPPDVFPGGEVITTGARADSRPPVGCSGHIDFVWDIDPATAPPGRPVGIIELTGGQEPGRYRRPLQGGTVRLSIDVRLTGGDVFTADLTSLGGQPAFPTPLTVTYDTPGC